MDKITVLSFDPGLTTSGWAFSEYNLHTNEMHVLYAGILEPNSQIFKKELKPEVIRYGSRIMTLHALREHVRTLVSTFKPNIIVSEDAFYNRFRPTAYCALIQWLSTVAMVLSDEFEQPLFKLSPKSVKLALAKSGKAGKLDMTKAITDNKTIKFSDDIVIDELTEHTYDSIGVGYAFIHETLPSLLRIWSIQNGKKEEVYHAITSTGDNQ